jgi:tetratricopeptide (TPR) repeat protein
MGVPACASPGATAPPASSAPTVARRDYALWVSWGCGIAAVVLLAVGVGRYGAERAAAAPSARPCAAEQSAPSAASVTQLRQEFDTLIAKNDARQIRVDEFGQGVKRIIADCQALLSRKDLPEPNAIHAQKLLADGYGAISEHQKESEAYVAFARRLSHYCNDHPSAFSGSVSKGLSVGQEVILRLLLTKAEDCLEANQYLPSAMYYEEIVRRFPTSGCAPYSLSQTGRCYLAYDLPQRAEHCFAALHRSYPSSPWAAYLLRMEAHELLKRHQYAAAAGTWLRISELSPHGDEKARCEVLAAGVYARAGKYAEAESLLERTVHQYGAFPHRRRALDLIAFCRDERLRSLVKEADKSILGM